MKSYRILHYKNKITPPVLALLSIVLLQGCVSKMPESPDGLTNSILRHRSPLVRYPAQAGFTAGVITGLPWAIPGTLIAYGIDAYADVDNKDELLVVPLGPSMILGIAGGYALGGPCWVAFGWWWPKDQLSENVAGNNPTHKNSKAVHEKVDQAP